MLFGFFSSEYIDLLKSCQLQWELCVLGRRRSAQVHSAFLLFSTNPQNNVQKKKASIRGKNSMGVKYVVPNYTNIPVRGGLKAKDFQACASQAVSTNNGKALSSIEYLSSKELPLKYCDFTLLQLQIILHSCCCFILFISFSAFYRLFSYYLLF